MCLQKVLCQTCSTYILLSSYLNFCICKQKGRRIIKIKSTLSKELGHLYISSRPQPNYIFSCYFGPKLHVYCISFVSSQSLSGSKKILLSLYLVARMSKVVQCRMYQSYYAEREHEKMRST